MNYLINRANLTLTVEHIFRTTDGYRLITKILDKRSKKPTIIVVINEKKLEGLKIEKGETYDFEGYFTDCEYFHDSRIYTIQLNADRIELHEIGKNTNNVVEFVCYYHDKTATIEVAKGKKVCNIDVDFLSENLKKSNIEIAVWNRAIKAIEHTKRGQKIHLTSFIFDNFNTGHFTSIKISPFKVTTL